MKYKCLILDHDDTVVRSTEAIHYPSFIAYLEEYMPHRVKDYTIESFIEKNFTPGIFSLFADELGMGEDEMHREQLFWEDFVHTRTPVAFPGIAEIVARFRAEGGIIAVSSHSMQRYIERDWAANGIPLPDEIYGWDLPRELRKPRTHTVTDLIAKYGFDKSEILMVDDLKPGYDMARAAGIAFAAAGWAYSVPLIEEFMREHSDHYLTSTEELSELLFN